MALIFSRSQRFRRTYRKLQGDLREKVKARIALALMNEFNPLLDNHALHGEWQGCRSINITGDYRVIFERWPDTFYAVAVGTHPELYGK